MKKLLQLSAIALLFTGCASNVHKIGHIGETELYSVHGRSFDGPNYSVLVEKSPDGKLNYVTAASGPGIGSAVIGAGGSVASSVLLRPAHTTISGVGSATGGNSNNRNTAASGVENSGNSAATAGGNSFVPPGLQDNPGHSK